MISKLKKFPMRTEFLRFRSRAKRSSTPHVTIFWAPARHNTSALGVVVPSKVSKLATTRNWLKRLVYDTLWTFIKDQNTSCVVVFKPFPLSKSEQTKVTIISELSVLNQPKTDN